MSPQTSAERAKALWSYTSSPPPLRYSSTMSDKDQPLEDLNAVNVKIVTALSRFSNDVTSHGWIQAKAALDAAVTEATDCYVSAVAARLKVKPVATPGLKDISLNIKPTGVRTRLQEKGSIFADPANFSPEQSIQPIQLDKLFTAHQVKPDQIFNQSLCEDIETVLNERVKLYEYKDGIWIELDKNHSQRKRQLNSLQVNKHNGEHITYSLSIGHAGCVRVWCSMKGMVFEKGQGKYSCGIVFAVPLDDEAKDNAAEGKVSKQFAIKVDAKREDGLLKTLNCVATDGTLMKQQDNDETSVGTSAVDPNFTVEQDGMDEETLYQIKARTVLVTNEEPEDNYFLLDKDLDSTLYAKQFDEGTLELRRKSSGKHRLVWYMNNTTNSGLTWEDIEGREVALQDFSIPACGPECMVRFVAILMKESTTGEYYMFRVRTSKVVTLYDELKKIGIVDMKPHWGLSDVQREV